MIALIHHPEDNVRLGDLLQKNFSDSKWRRFRAAVAFAKSSGTKHFCPHLRQFLRTGTVKLSVGIDHHGTSLEALSELLASMGTHGEIFVFHNEAQSTFHPKVYLFTNDKVAECLVGSGNLTEGGLFTNCELFAHLQLDRSKPADAKIIREVEAILDSWSNTALPTVRELTSEMLKQLQESGLVPTEAQIRETDAKAQATTAAKSSTKLAPKIFGAVKFKPAPKAPTQVRRSRKRSAAAAPAVPEPQVRGFVMTLQRTDVGVGQVTAGTSRRSPEIFIPLAARDANPEFWGWQSRFIQDAGKPGKWDRTGVRMRLGTEIIEVNMMTWPDKHDFRLRNAALRDAGVVDDVLRIEEAPARNAYDYYAEVIPRGSSDYAKYRGICVNSVRNSNKRWGYY